jgi:hypothetical protein
MTVGYSVILYPGAGEGLLIRSRTGTPSLQSSFDEGHGGSSTRRSMSKARRYIVANDLSTRTTLTWAEEPTREDALAETSLLMRRLRRNQFGGVPFPYMFVPESGHGPGHRLHVHALIPKMGAEAIISDWPHGLTHVTVAPDRPALRAAARYVVKDFSFSPRGQRRYRAARGFAPEAVRFVADDEPQAWREVNHIMGGPPTQVDVGHIIRAEWE